MQRARRPSKALSSDRLRGAAARGDEQLAARELEKGAEVDEEDEHTGYTALMEASEAGHVALVELLVRAHANTNLVDLRGWSALMKASKHGHTKLVRRLLLAGADPAVAADDGRTAADWATMSGHDETRQLIDAAVAGELPSTDSEEGDAPRRSSSTAVEVELDPGLQDGGASSPQPGLEREVQQLQQRLATMQAQVLRMDAAATASAATAASAGALQYVGQLSDRLAHVEAASEATQAQMLDEIDRLEELGEEQMEELSITAQMDKEVLRSTVDTAQARLTELAEKLSQVEGQVQAATSGMSSLREEFETVRDTSEETSISQAMELAAVRAAVEVEREARQYECSELTEDAEQLTQQVSRLREGLGLGPVTIADGDSDLGGGRAALASFLAAVELSHYLEVLEEVLGAAMIEDLLEMDAEDFDTLGLKKLERRRLLRGIDRLRAAAGLSPRAQIISEVAQPAERSLMIEQSVARKTSHQGDVTLVGGSAGDSVRPSTPPRKKHHEHEHEHEHDHDHDREHQHQHQHQRGREHEHEDLHVHEQEQAQEQAQDQEQDLRTAPDHASVPIMSQTIVGGSGGNTLGAVPKAEPPKPSGKGSRHTDRAHKELPVAQPMSPESPHDTDSQRPATSSDVDRADLAVSTSSPLTRGKKPKSSRRGHRPRAEYHSPRHSIASSNDFAPVPLSSGIAQRTRHPSSALITSPRSAHPQRQQHFHQQGVSRQHQQLQPEPQPEPDVDDDWLGLDALSFSVAVGASGAPNELAANDARSPSTYYEAEDFYSFLEAMRLESFVEGFMEHGYDDIAVLRALPEQQLDELLEDVGLGQGHAARFRIGIRSAREQPLALADLEELRVSATAYRPRPTGSTDEGSVISGGSNAAEDHSQMQVLPGAPKVFRMSMKTPLQAFVDKLARALRIGGTDEIVELTYDDGIDTHVIIVDEQDFADAKAVASKDAGCRLECRVELLSLEAVEKRTQEQAEAERLKELERQQRHEQMLREQQLLQQQNALDISEQAEASKRPA